VSNDASRPAVESQLDTVGQERAAASDERSAVRPLDRTNSPQDPANLVIVQGDQQKSAEEELQRFFATLAKTTPHAWVTGALIMVNFLVYLVMAAAGAGYFARTGQSLVDWGANYGPRIMQGEWWRLLSSNYVHVHLLHILLNMWVLADVGRLVERLLGSLSFFLLYTLSGVLGSVATLYFTPHVASAGASGAIFGLAGALLAYVLFAHQGLPRKVVAHLRQSVTLFIVLNVLIGFSLPNIGNAAHLGGLAAGFALGLLLQQRLGSDVPRGRLLRAVIAAALGGALVLAAAWKAPPIVDIEREWLETGDVERQVIEKAESLRQQVLAGELAPQAWADAIEREVIPPWSAQRDRLSHLVGLPDHVVGHFQRLSRYFAAREESWRCLVDGLRGNDARLEDFERHRREADRLLDEIRQKMGQ
jgi:rhomboid protease GluP